jgi:hypothetical protein
MNKFHPITTTLIIIFSIYFLCGCNSTDPNQTREEKLRVYYTSKVGKTAFDKQTPPKRELTQEEKLVAELRRLNQQWAFERRFLSWDRAPDFRGFPLPRGHERWPFQYQNEDTFKLKDLWFFLEK